MTPEVHGEPETACASPSMRLTSSWAPETEQCKPLTSACGATFGGAGGGGARLKQLDHLRRRVSEASVQHLGRNSRVERSGHCASDAEQFRKKPATLKRLVRTWHRASKAAGGELWSEASAESAQSCVTSVASSCRTRARQGAPPKQRPRHPLRFALATEGRGVDASWVALGQGQHAPQVSPSLEAAGASHGERLGMACAQS